MKIIIIILMVLFVGILIFVAKSKTGEFDNEWDDYMDED